MERYKRRFATKNRPPIEIDPAVVKEVIGKVMLVLSGALLVIIIDTAARLAG